MKMTSKFTFFGEYGTGLGRSEDLPQVYMHELERLKKYASKITSIEDLGKREFLDARNRLLLFSYIEAFKSLYIQVYGTAVTTNLFEIVRMFKQDKFDDIESIKRAGLGGLS